MEVFLDTNILLDLYRLSKEDLDNFEKIYALLENGVIRIYITQQVNDEFFRERDEMVLKAINTFKEQTLKLNAPAIFRADSEFDTLVELKKSYEQLHQKILKRIEKENNENTFEADRIVHQIIKKSECLKWSPDILNKAKLRKELGNPPGKKNTLGDQINWEILLEKKFSNDLHLISSDGDFFYGTTNAIKSFLKKEWAKNSGTELYGYTSLTGFFTKHYPDIRLASELNQELLISKLINSHSFSETHDAISKLSSIGAYTSPQIKRIVDAVINNDQIYRIGNDSDVASYIKLILTQYHDQIDLQSTEALKKFIVSDIDND